MLGQLALGLLLLGGDPVPAQVELQTQVEEVAAEPIPSVVEQGCSNCNGGCGDSCHLPCTWYNWWCPTCDLGQHLPYFPSSHGYYYFRPYNSQHIRQHQEFVASYGGDRRNPYSNDIFKQVYAEIAADRKREREAEGMGDAAPAPPVESTPAEAVPPSPKK